MNKTLGIGLLIAVLSVAGWHASADPLAEPQAGDLVRRALDALDASVNVQRSDPQAAARALEESIALWRSLMDAGYANAAVHANLAAAYFRRGELGRAILHSRRALRLEPRQRLAREQLAQWRPRVEPRIEPSTAHRMRQRWLQFGAIADERVLFRTLILLGLAGSIALALRSVWRRAWLGWVAAGAATTSLLLMAAVLNLRSFDSRRPVAVVVADRPTLRAGRGEGYDAVLAAPLGAGVELRIVEQRGDWLRVELENGILGWLPAASVERV